MPLRPAANNFKRLFLGVFLLVVIWLILTEGDLASLIVGVVFVPLAMASLFWLWRQRTDTAATTNFKLSTLPRFMVFFIGQSIVGGLTTAKQALAPKMGLQPEFVHYKTRYLSIGTNSTLFVNLVSLLPGSLIVLQESDGILLHVLANNESIESEIAKCELIVAQLLGIQPIQSHLIAKDQS